MIDGHGTLLNASEAMNLVEQLDDVVTKNLLRLVIVTLVRRYAIDRRDYPRCDMDVLYLVQVLKDLFSRHDLIARTLNGERPGAFFEDEE